MMGLRWILELGSITFIFALAKARDLLRLLRGIKVAGLGVKDDCRWLFQDPSLCLPTSLAGPDDKA